MEGKSSGIPEQKPEIQELSVEHASMLLFLSFRFSQGNPALQNQILKWVHGAYPSYRLTPENLALVRSKVKQMSSDFIFKVSGRHTKGVNADSLLTDSIIEKNVDEFSIFFADKLSSKPLSSEEKEVILINIINLLLERDYKYLVQDGGRPVNRSLSSHIVSYGINHKPTGVSEYDQMFHEIYELVVKEKESDSKWGFSSLSLGILKAVEEAHKDKNS